MFDIESVGIIIAVRTQSKRLEKKVLQKINNKTCFQILLDHVINLHYPVFVATTLDQEDDEICNIADENGIEVFRSDRKSPAHELLNVAQKRGLNYIVRITADDILIDFTILKNMVKFAINGGHEYVYATKCPDATIGEIIKTSVLEDVIKKNNNERIEYLSYYLKDKYKTKEYYPPLEYQYRCRLTLDYREDLLLLRTIFNFMKNPGTLDIINFFKNNPFLHSINKLPAITIYTCIYNHEKFIKDCIKSVINQSFQDYEYIIIDDCSEDNSLKIILNYYSSLSPDIQKKIKIIRNEKNEGLGTCCNKILDIAKGQYIVRLDSDDLFCIDFLEKMHEYALANKASGILSHYYEVDENFKNQKLISENKGHPACCLLEKKCVNEIKYVEKINYGEGKLFFDKWNEKIQNKILEIPLWYYRQHENQKTKQKNYEVGK